MKYGYYTLLNKTIPTDDIMGDLLEQGINREQIYFDYFIPASRYNVNFNKLIKKLKKGDVLYLYSISSLNKDMEHILITLYQLLKKKIEIVDLSNTFKEDDFTQFFKFTSSINSLVISRNKKYGISRSTEIGRPTALTKTQLKGFYKKIDEGWQSNKICKHYSISLSTYWRYFYKNNEME